LSFTLTLPTFKVPITHAQIFDTIELTAAIEPGHNRGTMSISLLPSSDWTICGPHETIDVPVILRAGWHRLRIDLRTPDRPGIHKRLTIAIGDELLSLSWNETLRDTLIVHLDHPVSLVQFQFHHAAGRLQVNRFALSRTTPLRAVAGAMTAKVSLLRQFQCLSPVLKRGGQLLVQGRFREFGAKLMKGLPDQRTLSLERNRADEAKASWWRRDATSAEAISALLAEADAIANPEPIAVIIPVDKTRVDHARQSIFSVLRQAYPHWQLRVLWPTASPPWEIAEAVRRVGRARVITSGDGDLATALQAAVSDLPVDRVLFLGPDDELTAAALLRIAQHRSRESATTLAAIVASPPPACPTAITVMQWAARVKSPDHPDGESVMRSLDTAAGATFTVPKPIMTSRLHLAANLVGITGWDAVAYQVLHGLTSRGVEVLRHPAAIVKSHVLPPTLPFEEVPRTCEQAQLIIAAPFQLSQFMPDQRSAVITMWECDRLAAAAVAMLNRARVVIVPSEWCRASFLASGVNVPIELMPLGVDPLLYHPKSNLINKYEIVIGMAGALGAGGMRKNLTTGIAAFQLAFPHRADVRLRIKITPNCPPLDDTGDHRIEVTRAMLPAADVAAWYRSLSVFMNPSMAEGFGLHLIEAMACGVPVISTAATGDADYVDEAVGWVVPHLRQRVRNDYYDGHWYRPDGDALADTLRDLTCEQIIEKGLMAAARARTFTWRRTIRELSMILNRHGLLTEAL
jgi:glycosyltransferase involved in cell wall biosynthesis